MHIAGRLQARSGFAIEPIARLRRETLVELMARRSDPAFPVLCNRDGCYEMQGLRSHTGELLCETHFDMKQLGLR